MFSTMQIIGTSLLLSLMLVGADASRAKRSTCDDKYYNVTPSHTMCLNDNNAAVPVTLTQEAKDEIVDMHNEIRANVSDAANMRKVKWDDRLAAVAQKWAMQCTGGHDGYNERSEPDLPGFVGQNVAWGTPVDHADAVNLWAAEIVDFVYGNWTYTTGHYIQQIFASTSLVGCGHAKCGNTDYVVCNYYSGTVGNEPYLKGSPCDKCPQSCQDGLCDCTSGPDACFNGGAYNISSCSCECPRLWNGTICTTKNCPQQDFDQMCSYPQVITNPDQWCEYSNFQRDCPILCGQCPNSNSTA